MRNLRFTKRLLARLALLWLLVFALMQGAAPRSGRWLSAGSGNLRSQSMSEGEILDSVEEVEALEVALHGETRRMVARRPLRPVAHLEPEHPRHGKNERVAPHFIAPSYRAPPHKPLIRLLN